MLCVIRFPELFGFLAKTKNTPFLKLYLYSVIINTQYDIKVAFFGTGIGQKTISSGYQTSARIRTWNPLAQVLGNAGIGP